MFNLIKIENARMNVPEPEYLPCGSTAVTSGELLALSSGKLVAATSATEALLPAFVACEGADANAVKVCVFRLAPDQIYETTFSAVPTSVKIGDVLQAKADGLQVTATPADPDDEQTPVYGNVRVVDMLGATAIGDKVRVRFDI